MKPFKKFNEDMGAAPATCTTGVAGAGDNSDTVPVSRKKKNSPVIDPLLTRKPPNV